MLSFLLGATISILTAIFGKSVDTGGSNVCGFPAVFINKRCELGAWFDVVGFGMNLLVWSIVVFCALNGINIIRNTIMPKSWLPITHRLRRVIIVLCSTFLILFFLAIIFGRIIIHNEYCKGSDDTVLVDSVKLEISLVQYGDDTDIHLPFIFRNMWSKDMWGLCILSSALNGGRTLIIKSVAITTKHQQYNILSDLFRRNKSNVSLQVAFPSNDTWAINRDNGIFHHILSLPDPELHLSELNEGDTVDVDLEGEIKRDGNIAPFKFSGEYQMTKQLDIRPYWGCFGGWRPVQWLWVAGRELKAVR